MANYLQRPPVYQAIQWTGSNASNVQAQVDVGNPNTGGTSFQVDANGNATITIYYSNYPVAINDWLVTSSGSTQQPLTDAQFQSLYVAGSSWTVAP